MKKKENVALRNWVNEGANGRGSGRITELAKHLGLSQPAVSKIVDGSSHIKIEYVQQILDFTGIKPKDLLPDWYEFFKEDDELINIEWKINIHKQSLIAALDLKFENIIRELES